MKQLTEVQKQIANWMAGLLHDSDFCTSDGYVCMDLVESHAFDNLSDTQDDICIASNYVFDMAKFQGIKVFWSD